MKSPPPADPRAELRALLRWALADKVSGRRLREAVLDVGSARALGEGGHPALRGRTPRSLGEVEEVLRRCHAAGVRPVPWFDPAYPSDLLQLREPPPVLYLRGTLPDPDRTAVAVVGSRRAGGYGRRVARELSREAARHGVVVVSGLALGIDGEAHAGALEAEGTTVAVLGGGVERARPSAHRRLYREILNRGGAVVGEWPPGTPARAFHFPRRNRILAALARLVVVIEASARSGALSTAAHARRLGRDVAAVPGPIDQPGHRGSNELIRDGAGAILEVDDLLDLAGVVGALAAQPERQPQLTGDTAPVWRSLHAGPASVEHVAERAGLPVARVLRALTRLEVDGWVRRDRGLHTRAAGPLA